MQIVKEKEIKKFYITDLKLGEVFSFRNTVRLSLHDEIAPDEVFLFTEFGLDTAIVNLKNGEASAAEDFLEYEIVQYKNATLTLTL